MHAPSAALRHHRPVGSAGSVLRNLPVGVLVAILAGAPWVVRGQEDGRFSSWTKVEAAAETRAYKEAVRAGTFDASTRGYLEQIALPQLELPANRHMIERIRKRIREFLLGDMTGEKTVADANATVLAFLEGVLAKDDAEPAVKVNAMLMIGELQGPDRKPWPPALAPLVKTLSDRDASASLRIAACVGLARHVEATKGIAEEQQRVAGEAGPAIVAILEEPARPETLAETDWLASRCLALAPLLGPAGPQTLAAVVKLVGDTGRSFNLRVRAAAAAAALAGPAAKLDRPALIEAIKAVAIEALENDVAAGDKRTLERIFGVGPAPAAGGPPGMGPSGFGPPGMAPGGFGPPGVQPSGFGPPGTGLDPSGNPLGEPTIHREACRRAAWRLAVLADAILSDDGKRGIAAAGGDVPQSARELAQRLRRAAMDLDATPEEATLRQSLTDLKPPAPAAKDDQGEGEKTG